MSPEVVSSTWIQILIPIVLQTFVVLWRLAKMDQQLKTLSSDYEEFKKNAISNNTLSDKLEIFKIQMSNLDKRIIDLEKYRKNS